jgi:ABC-type multidrug transport system fused ATPase/permease subunit
MIGEGIRGSHLGSPFLYPGDQRMQPAAGARDGESDLGLLGTGRHGDRLSFRLIVRLLLRCLPLLRGVGGHLAALLGGFALASGPSILLIFGLAVIWWNSALGDQPLSPWQATFLGLEPASAVEVDTLDAETRRAVASGLRLRGVVVIPIIVSVFFGLFYYQVWILQRVNQTLRLRLVDRLQELSLRFHADSRVGDAIYRMVQDSAMVTQLIDVVFLSPLRAASSFAIGLGGAALFSPWLALLLLAVWPVTLLLGLWISWRLRVGFRNARETNSSLTSRIQESLLGIKVIKAFGLEEHEQRRFEDASRTAFSAALSARTLLAFFGVATFWMVTAAVLVAVWQGGLLTVGAEVPFAWRALQALGLPGGGLDQVLLFVGLGAWTLGSYNAFKGLFGWGTGAVQRLFGLWGRTQDVAIGLDRVFELLDLEPEVRDAPDAVDMPRFESSISFRGVRFGYRAERPVLEGIDLEAKAGTITAIVGPTGSGKSTLMALLLRLFDPWSGEIRIDGRDLRRLRVESLRANVSIALQENVLFGTTVRENVRYAVPDASDDAVRAAARVACAAEFIEPLPEGYDTLLGERGTKLSTGQRQRLSIARALLKDTPILILDEPTASLDAETELRLLRNLADWGRGRAIFVVTHRLSTVRRADQIVYLEGGRAVEVGSHDELMSRAGGAYRRLVDAEESPRVSAGEAAR